ncbi:MAG: sensor domain-containing diguanylate cyclase [Armatimonadetes bacterium]|nr:sensor domain-containing diguanylate cyclase [Armatimonadota bacterium]
MSEQTGDRRDETLIAIVQGSSEALALAHADGTIVAANEAMVRLFEHRPLVGADWRSLIQVDHYVPKKEEDGADPNDRFVAEISVKGGSSKVMSRLQTLPNGMSVIGMECPETAFGGSTANPIPQLTDLSSQLVIQALHYQELYVTTDKQAKTDALTGLLNRKALDDAYVSAHAMEAFGPRPVSLLMLDVDHFKRLNDTRGHLTGDEALKNLAVLLKRVCRSTDTVARYGGEEFSVLMAGADSDIALNLAERIRAAVEGTSLCVDPVTVSIGVADCMIGDEPLESLIARADAALYESKRGGRNRVTLASARPDVSAA